MKIDHLIWINGMPRSGTSWLSQIFDSHPAVSFKLSPLFSYAFKNQVNATSSRSDWEQFFEDVLDSNDNFVNQTYRRVEGEYPEFDKTKPTHLVIKETRYHHLTEVILDLFKNIKFIHIVRHPCGAINSWLRAPKEFNQNLNPIDQWRTGKSRKTSPEEFWGFNDWLLLTKKYLKLQDYYPNNVKLIYYEKLVKNPLNETFSMFDFVGLNLTDQTKQFIHESQNSHHPGTYAVFKSKSVMEAWKSELDQSIVKEIQEDLVKNQLDHLF